MIEFVAIVLLIALLFSNRSLNSRISTLEAKIKNTGPLASRPSAAAIPQTVVTGGMAEYLPGAQPTTISAGIYGDVEVPAGGVHPYVAQMRQPDGMDRFGAWLKEDWLMKLGGFIFIMGCGWFVSYAFANNWIGPVGRISLGIIAGALVMVFGFWRMMKYASQGAVFLAIGAAMAMLSIYAGRSIYQFFTPSSAVLFDFIIAAFVSFASHRFNLKALAFTAQILAFIAPLLAAGPSNSIFLFSYLLAISIATLVLAGITGWRDLIISSLVFVGFYSIPYVTASHGYYQNAFGIDAPLVLNFAYLFSTLYLLSGMSAVVKRGVTNAKNEVVLAVLNGLFLFIWIQAVADTEWKSLLFAAWAVVFAVGSFIAFRASNKPDPFYAYGSIAVAFIAAATAAQLQGSSLTIAFSIEVLMLVMTVLVLTKSTKSASATLALFVAPIALSFASMQAYLFAHEVFTKELFVLFILGFSLILAGRLIGNVERDTRSEPHSQLWSVSVILGTLYVWFIIWCVMHILMPLTPDIATFVSLTIYTVAGLWAYFNGLRNTDAARRVYGVGLLIFVVVRLLLVDVWQMELFGRVITFFVIGALLMSTAFLTKRKSIAPAAA